MAMAAVVLLAAAVGAGVAWRARAPAPREPIVFTVTTPSTADPSSFALSPDGRQLAFTAMDTDGQQKLWIRPLDSSAPRVLPGSIDAATPFWSHDSRSVAFFTPGFLKRIDQSGGPAQTISGVALGTALGGTWSERDVILFASATSGGILRVAAAGGEAAHVTSLGTGEGTHAWPMFMPDGRHLVYLKARPAAGSSELVWRALDSTEERVVRRMPSKAAYSPTGHLVFRLDGPLVGQRFDAEHGSVSGDTIQLASDMWTGGGIASRAAIDLSPAGVLAYRPGEEAGVVAQLTWFDREGNVLAKVGSPGDYRNLTIDLAGDHAAANTSGDVWGFDVKRGTTSRLTFDPAADSDPIFSPDGRWLVFYSARNPPGIYRKAANGAGADELVAQTGLLSYTRDWSSDGRFVLFVKGSDAGGGADLWVLPMEGDRKPFAYLATPANEEMARFSPDADWVAYHSSETGRREVFVQDFPVKGAKFQASTAGGTDPRWRRDGRELFYLGPDGRLMSMTVETKPEFRLDAPKAVFQTPLLHLSVDAQRRYAISADGQRFLMNVPVGVGALAPITVVVNWSPALPIH
jgi:Tol biopolymer transport system component